MSEDKKDKSTYEAPKVMPLGELAKGAGAPCNTGGSASSCSIGSVASNNCNPGTTAAVRCGDGSSPRCRTGFLG